MVGIGTLLTLVWFLSTAPSNRLLVFSWPQPQIVSSYMCTDQYPAEYSRGILCRSLEFYFLSTILPCKLCLCLPGLSPLPPQFRESARLCLGSSSLCPILETQDNQGNHFVSYPLGITILCFLIPSVLKPLLHVFVWIFRYFRLADESGFYYSYLSRSCYPNKSIFNFQDFYLFLFHR